MRQWLNGRFAEGRWRSTLPYFCLIASAVLVLIVGPPSKLVDLLGSSFWASAVLGLLVFLVMGLVLTALGLIDRTIGLPFGISVANSGPGPDLPALLELGQRLSTLQEADGKAFKRLEEVLKLQKDMASRLDEMDRRIDEIDRRTK